MERAAPPGTSDVPAAATLPERAAPWIATGFVALCLATIPYGAPPGRTYNMAMVTTCVAMLGCARLSVSRWDRLTVWPVIVLLAAYALGCWASVDQPRSIARFATMPLFAMTFMAVQVAASDARALRTLALAGVAAMLAIVVDVAFARATGQALFHEGAASMLRTAGSQGNPNDLAAASLLLPLAWLAAPRRGMVICYAACAAVVSLAWVLSAGRQVAIGWFVAALVPVMMQVGWKRGMWMLASLSAVAAVAIMIDPYLRSRVVETMQSGLGDRMPLFVFGLWQWWQRPWLGNGPGTFGELYLQAVAADWSWSGIVLDRFGRPWVHNLLIEVLDDLGIVGAVAFTLVLTAAAGRIRRSLSGDDSSRRVAIAAIATGLAIAAVGLVDLTFIKDWFRCVFWLALGLAFLPERLSERGSDAQDRAKNAVE